MKTSLAVSALILAVVLVVGGLAGVSAQAPVEISFYYPVAVGGPITKIVDGYAADFTKENPSIRVKPIYTGTYQEITRPKRLVFTWNSPYAGSHGSLVTVDFKPKGRGTEIVLTHERLPSEEMVKAHTGGWTSILERLVATYADTRATA